MCKKILYIVTKADLGGVSNYLLEIVRNFPSDYVPYFIMSNDGYLSDELIKLNLKENVFFVPMTNSITDIATHIKSILQTLKVINNIKPDLIHCNSTTAGIVGRICGFLCRIPVVFTAHGWAFTGGISKQKQLFYKILETLLAFITDKIICVSEYDRQLALKVFPYFKNKLVTIHNGISDIPEKYIQAYDNVENKNEIDVVMVSRFCPQKDPYTLIDAVNELIKEEQININLNLYGYGPELEQVKQKIASCDNSKIKYLGETLKPHEVIINSDIYALISNWEGLPIGIIEAMRAQMPIIACNVGGNSEAVLDGNNGFIISRKDKIALKLKLKELYENTILLKSFGTNSRKLYKVNFSAESMINKTFKVYGDML